MMAALGAKLRTGDGGAVFFHCPGCAENHVVYVGPGPRPRWRFNGDGDRPTFSPSVLVRWGDHPGAERCHSYVTDGQIRFLPDCTHGLAGQTVELPDWPRG